MSAFHLSLSIADDGRGSADALQLTVPIEGLQDPVSLATSFAVQAAENETAAWVEGLELPSALPGSGGIEIQAGVGRLPSVLASARQIMETNVKYVSSFPICSRNGANAGIPLEWMITVMMLICGGLFTHLSFVTISKVHPLQSLNQPPERKGQKWTSKKDQKCTSMISV